MERGSALLGHASTAAGGAEVDSDPDADVDVQLTQTAQRERCGPQRRGRPRALPRERLLVVGTACVDTVDHLGEFPSENSELHSRSRMRRLGGNGANLARSACQFDRLHCTLMYCTTDERSDSNAGFVKQVLEKDGILDLGVLTGGGLGLMPASFVILCNNGSRTIVHHRSLPELGVDDFQQYYVPFGYTWVHFEGRNVPAVSRMMDTISSSCTISLEVEKDRAPGDVLSLLQRAHVVVFGKAFANGRGFKDGPAFLRHIHSRGAELKVKDHTKLVVAWGEAGAFGCAYAAAVTDEAAVPVVHAAAGLPPGAAVVDTIGAGDVFNASLIVAFMRGLDLASAMAFACRIASRRCTQQGVENLARFDDEASAALPLAAALPPLPLGSTSTSTSTGVLSPSARSAHSAVTSTCSTATHSAPSSDATGPAATSQAATKNPPQSSTASSIS